MLINTLVEVIQNKLLQLARENTIKNDKFNEYYLERGRN